MKGILQALFFGGLIYYVFEAIFNYVAYDLLDKKKTLKEKLRLKPSVMPSLWMIPVGALCIFLIHLYLLIPFNYFKIFPLILLGFITCIIITSVELGSGILLNRKLKLNLWEYDTYLFGIRINIMKQIDLYHSIGWFFIAYPFLILDKILL